MLKLITTLIVIVVFIASLLALWIKIAPGSTASLLLPLIGDSAFLKKAVCAHPVIILDSSLEPKLKRNSTIAFNKCIEKERDIKIGAIVVYKTPVIDVPKTGIVKNLSPDEDKYIVSPGINSLEFISVSSKDILAVYEE